MHLYQKILGSLVTVAMALTGVAAYAAPAAAQTYNSGNPGVASVSLANGSVVIVRGDSGAQVAATINAPVLPGDYIATNSGSNAEVQFDGISMLRLAHNTQVRFVNLNPNSREMQLASGTVDLAELQGADGSPKIDTPSLTVRPNQSGDYRVSVLGNGETLITVRNGSATVADANGSQTLSPGSTLVANGSSISMQNAIGFDSFDQFNNSRDQAVVTAYNSNPYVSPQLAGYSNFANYGQWQNVPGYGYAWAPNNQSQSNFAPYQNGQWVWEPGYGYTWVDNSPYGYATSHYGTWFNNSNYGGWLWQPPASQYQNSSSSLASAWLPAVVSFFLSGNNGGSLGNLGNILGGLSGLVGSSSNADIGWIPLAPGEQYQPWYGQNASYPSTGLTNVTNVSNIYNIYSNARYYRGATMVPVRSFRTGNFRREDVLRPQQLRQIVLIRGAVPIVPTTANLHYSSIAVRHPVVLSRAFAAPRLAARAPRVVRVSFQTQQARIRSIAAVRPRSIPLPARRTAIAHPVYHPVAHAKIHVTALRPVTRRANVAKPATHRATITRPITHRATVARPTTHRATVAEPVTRRATVTRPATRRATVITPVRHRATPVIVKPIRPRATPVIERPIVHRAASTVVRPVTRREVPAARPVAPRAAAPAARPEMRAAPLPAARPATHPATRPAARRERPAARPTARPDRTSW